MGASIPVLGAVTGVLGAVQQNNAQQQQAAAQRAALDQQAIAEKNNTQLRLMELERQRNFSDFQYQIDLARREIQKENDANALTVAGLQDEQARLARTFENQQGLLQQMTANQDLKGAAQATAYGAKTQAQQMRAAESEQGRAELAGLANAGAQMGMEQDKATFQRGTAFANLAGGGAMAGLGLSDVANLANLALSGDTRVQEYLGQYSNVVDQIKQGSLNADTIAALVQQIGLDNASFMSDTADRTDQFVQGTAAYNQQAIDNAARSNQLGLQAAQSAQGTQYTIDAANSALNRSYYDLERASQRGAIQTSGNAIQSQIAAQRGAISAPSGFMNLLSAGVQAAPIISGAFRGGGSISSQASQFGYGNAVPTGSYGRQVGDYGLTAAGTPMNEYNFQPSISPLLDYYK